ncbi:MAG: tRNA (N(6)-L-threonylcarbamoyladenosine(37)-C(2))-methylthiotransferase MtaB [Pseudomonadota bacterium]
MRKQKSNNTKNSTSRIPDTAPRFSITTLGCKVNRSESDAIARRLELSQWIPADVNEKTDLCIINTCTVTRKAAMQSRQAIRQTVRSNPGARILVTGCYAQTEPDEIKKIDGIHYIVGHFDKHNIPEIMVADPETHRSRPTPGPEIIWQDIRKERTFQHTPVAAFGNRTRPVLKVQDGCDAFCTYCIVPYARGRSRSMPLENVLKNITQLKQAGFREVVLSGIHLGSYGVDLLPKTSLFDLLKHIDTSAVIERVRLSSIEPHELTEEIIHLTAESEILCDHFHIPLQSGDDRILEKMNRPYTNRLFRELVLRIRKQMPDAAIGVDVLVGFPGETDNAFENTCALISELPVSYLHVFPFSARSGTPASKFSGIVATETIKARALKVREIGFHKKSVFYNSFSNEKIEVLVEAKSDFPEGLMKGISENYIPIFFKEDVDLTNAFVNVRINTIDSDNKVYGAIV